MEIKQQLQIIRHEGLKNLAEQTLHQLGQTAIGERIIETYAYGAEGRIRDPALHTVVAGMKFENPVMVGAGWDKKGHAIRGLYDLGFSGVEVGTVPLLGQTGNPKPRLWTLGRDHAVGLNRLGFNSPGSEAVGRYLEHQKPYPCRVGINVGKNKLMPDEQSPWAHAEVVRQLYHYADYFVFNPSSPNTPNLRELQRREPMKAHIAAMQQAMIESDGPKPFFVKIAPDLTPTEFNDIVEVAVEMGVTGIIACNTTVSEAIKAKHGRPGEAGGISGNEWEYRSVVQRMVYDIYELAGDKLEIIGVGGISTAEHAIELMYAGASLVQVVTGIREHKGRIAATINRDILDWLHRHKVNSIQNIIGAAHPKAKARPSGNY